MKFVGVHDTQNWGDNIGKIWVAEYLNNKLNEPCEFGIDDKNREGRYSDWIHLPFNNCSVQNPDFQIMTHHRHVWEAFLPKQNSGKPLFFDLHGLTFKFIMEDWFPTFRPTDRLQEQFDGLNLPEKYVVIHHGKNETFQCRLDRCSELFDEELEIDGPLFYTDVSLGFPGENISHIHGLLKLLVLIRAHKIFVTHSGFTAIASIYRRRKNAFLINYVYPNCLFMGPPVISYSNCFFQTNNYKKLLWFAKTFDWEKYLEFVYQNSHTVREKDGIWFKENCQYETLRNLDFNFEIPEDFAPDDVSFDQENCLVPADTMFWLDSNLPVKLLPNNTVHWGPLHFGRGFS